MGWSGTRAADGNGEEEMSEWLVAPDGTRYKPPPSEEEGKRRTERANQLIGQPFVHLPGKPPQHKVLADIDGLKIRVETVEMVWNDKNFIDYVCGEGHYRKDLEQESNASQLKVLDLAESLYGDTVPYHGL